MGASLPAGELGQDLRQWVLPAGLSLVLLLEVGIKEVKDFLDLGESSSALSAPTSAWVRLTGSFSPWFHTPSGP